jgi:hypothetical protein
MIDDEFQLPVLAARYLGDSAVTPEQKRAFLFDSSDGRGTRLALLLREMALVATWTAPYARDPKPANLVSFPKRDPTHWRSASWRDSDAGYTGGRFAMDINIIWVPKALQSIDTILEVLPSLVITSPALDGLIADPNGALAGYVRNRSSLSQAIGTWEWRTPSFQGESRAGGNPAPNRREAGVASCARAILLEECDGRARRGARIAHLPGALTRLQWSPHTRD